MRYSSQSNQSNNNGSAQGHIHQVGLYNSKNREMRFAQNNMMESKRLQNLAKRESESPSLFAFSIPKAIQENQFMFEKAAYEQV